MQHSTYCKTSMAGSQHLLSGKQEADWLAHSYGAHCLQRHSCLGVKGEYHYRV